MYAQTGNIQMLVLLELSTRKKGKKIFMHSLILCQNLCLWYDYNVKTFNVFIYKNVNTLHNSETITHALTLVHLAHSDCEQSQNTLGNLTM